MAEVSFMASTSSADKFQEPSVEIIDPKSRKSSIASNEGEDVLKYPNRPSESLWKQQKLPAWQPVLSADVVLPAFFILGIAFIPIGVGLLISSNQVQEFIYDYTDCHHYNDPTAKCSDKIGEAMKKNLRIQCICHYNFTLEEDFKAPVFFYYGISKFYQNHRRYVKSRDDYQLAGKVTQLNDLSKDCEKPFREFDSKPIAPCGAIANSLFNDTFKLYLKPSTDPADDIHINMIDTGIAWPTDREMKYNNPEDFQNTAKPLFWEKTVSSLDPNHPNNNGYKNERLIVWMRPAALPSFKKLWGRINHDQTILRTSLPKGNYNLQITYNYPVILDKYVGGKQIIISNTSWLGGKNGFLGYAYIIVGSLCLLLWLAFLIIVKKYSQNPKDMVDIGPKTPYNLVDYKSTHNTA